MQAIYINVTFYSRALVAAIAATLLALVLVIPTAQATSVAEVAQATDEESADDGASNPARIPSGSAGVEFQESNWHFDSGSLMTEEVESSDSSGNPEQLRNQILYQEANWDFFSGDPLLESQSTDGNPVDSRLTRNEVRFQEANWNHASGTLIVEGDS